MSAWKVIFATLVIFIAGAFTGGLLVTNTFNVLNSTHPAQAGQPHPAGNTNAVVQMGNPWLARSKNLLQRMDRELNLTPEQHQHMETLISNSQERTRELWKPIVPSMNKEFQFLRVEMRDQLTPEQQVQFDSFFKLRPGMDRRNNHGTNSSFHRPDQCSGRQVVRQSYQRKDFCSFTSRSPSQSVTRHAVTSPIF